jgi:hypothetical protein
MPMTRVKAAAATRYHATSPIRRYLTTTATTEKAVVRNQRNITRRVDVLGRSAMAAFLSAGVYMCSTARVFRANGAPRRLRVVTNAHLLRDPDLLVYGRRDALVRGQDPAEVQGVDGGDDERRGIRVGAGTPPDLAQ